MDDSRTRQLALFALIAVVVLFAFAFFFLRFPILWDSDSYYHLAVARHYGEEGIAAKVPWLRYSLLSGGADKEFLFHVALIPFTIVTDAAVGGRLALALLNAAVFLLLGRAASRSLGAWGWLVPIWFYATASPFLSRSIRLRPELLALVILLVAIELAAARRWSLLAFVSFAFALSYTAFHVFAAIVILWFVAIRLRESRWELPLLGAGLGGVAAGLVLRPHPVENLELWVVQNIHFFLRKSELDVGEEIGPPKWGVLLTESYGWIAGAAVLGVLLWRTGSRRDRHLLLTAVPLAVFAVLFLFMGRMTTWVFPLATAALCSAIGPAEGRQRAVAAALLALCAAIGLPATLNPTLWSLIGPGASAVVTEADQEAFGKAVPEGARVAADWGTTALYVFWAPQGRYLNALDPIFMARPWPREYALQRAIFEGRSEDVPAALRALDSDYLAFDVTAVPPQLLRRLAGDPRFEVVYGGYNVLLKVRPQGP